MYKRQGKCSENINNEVMNYKVSVGVKINNDYNGGEIMLSNNKEVFENGVSNSDILSNSGSNIAVSYTHLCLIIVVIYFSR